MKYFKHYTSLLASSGMQEIITKYGIAGYGYFVAILELISKDYKAGQIPEIKESEIEQHLSSWLIDKDIHIELLTLLNKNKLITWHKKKKTIKIGYLLKLTDDYNKRKTTNKTTNTATNTSTNNIYNTSNNTKSSGDYEQTNLTHRYREIYSEKYGEILGATYRFNSAHLKAFKWLGKNIEQDLYIKVLEYFFRDSWYKESNSLSPNVLRQYFDELERAANIKEQGKPGKILEFDKKVVGANYGKTKLEEF